MAGLPATFMSWVKPVMPARPTTNSFTSGFESDSTPSFGGRHARVGLRITSQSSRKRATLRPVAWTTRTARA